MADQARCWFRRLAQGAAALLLSAAALAQSAPPAPIPIEQFTRLPAIDSMALSPSGKRLAMIVAGPEGRLRLAVMDLEPMGKARIVGEFSDADVRHFQWVNDNRLVFEAYHVKALIQAGDAGTFAVDDDGKNARQLIAWMASHGAVTTVPISAKLLPSGWTIGPSIDDGDDEVFVIKHVQDSLGDLREVQLSRLNTRTGALTNLSAGLPANVHSWWMDRRHEPRMLMAVSGGRDRVYWREGDDKAWTEVAEFDDLARDFVPWFIDADGQVLALSQRLGDTAALYRYDPKRKRLDPEPVVRLDGFDLSPHAETDGQTGHLVGIHYTSDGPQSYWFDADLQRIQRGVDAALPAGRSNRLSCGRCESSRFLLVRSSSDRQFGEYYLYDRNKSSLQALGPSRPWTQESAQARRSFHRFAARDGLSVPLYVTHPVGAVAEQRLPAVLLVHGGPWVRGSDLGWSAEAQFYASRGYRVLEPEFRGSAGYGWRHFHAGWKQWGLAMQDDLADAVQWAARQGLIDPARVCIVGGSYGGYAALMGPIAHPGTYRCAASLAGVTDIDLMYSVSWSDFSEEYKRYGMPVLVGDRVKDAEMLARSSPIKRVAEIKVPLLLAHGAQDHRVPIVHEQDFVAAARQAGVDVEVHLYPEEGHGFYDPANRADYYGHLERFLAKALKEPGP